MVHALAREAVDDLGSGNMARRVPDDIEDTAAGDHKG